MILVKKIVCKNFLSYGNAPTEFVLNKHKATLVRGKNGNGKSALLDLLMYGLYGKPYRSINKPQLVNSINKGDMLVEIDFSIGASEYKVRRGIKPNVFDIIKDGKLVEQDAAIRDYQEFLETQILRVSEKTFKQIAVLGSASFVPFMKLSASQRRELIESILDIEVFSKMNSVLKERILVTKEEYTSIENSISKKKLEAVAQQKLIQVMLDNTNARIDDYKKEKEFAQSELTIHETKLKIIQDEINGLVEPEFDSTAYKNVTDKIDVFQKERTSLIKKRKSIASLDECPTCLQKVDESHILNLTDGIKTKLSDLDELCVSLEERRKVLEGEKSKLDDFYKEHATKSQQALQLSNLCNLAEKEIRKIDDKIVSILSENTDIEAEKKKLVEIGQQAMQLLKRKNVLSEEKHLQEVASQLLKDTGIKTAVVKEYLPVLNQLINKYLSLFNFFVDFTLNESFEEVIKSRGRDVFSYASFSEGEKRRIDLAILMSFRQLAGMKNSAKTNILIFDEIADGAFDLEARAAFNDLLGNITNSNIIVISHADASTEQYDRVIQVEKKGDFSFYEVVE